MRDDNPSHQPAAEAHRHNLPVEPPPGPPWDAPMHEAPLAFVDLEMTGLDPHIDRVVEVCIERWRGSVMESRLESLVDPGPDTCFHTDVHGIDRSMLMGAPSFAGLADRVVDLCAGAILVAHGATWDVTFLRAELARTGIDWDLAFYLDTLTLSRRALLAPSHALAALASHLGIPQHSPHRAGSDVTVLHQLYEQLLASLKPTTPRDLWHVRVGEKQVRPEVLAACTSFAQSGEVVEICYRPSRKGPHRIMAVVTRMRTDLDPPRVMGYALPDRGRFDMRADRILWATARPRPDSDTKAR